MISLTRGATGALVSLVALSLVACSSGGGADQTSDQVVFGNPASDHAEAVLVDVMKGGQPANSCSGALVAPYVVVTAAHCIDGNDGFKVTAPFAGGQVADSTTGLTLDYAGVGANLDLQKHDVGVIILASPITLTSYPRIAQAELGDSSRVVLIGRAQDGQISSSTLFASSPVPVRDGASSGAPNDYLSQGVMQEGDWGGPIESADAPGNLVAVVSGSAVLRDANQNPNGSYDYLARLDLVAPWIAQQIAAFPQGAPATPQQASFPAPFGDAAQVATSGGAVLTTPKVMAITYDADTMRDPIERFAQGVGATEWWKATTSEYGVGTLVAEKPVHLSAAPPATITDDQIKAFLTSMLDGKHADFGAPDPSTIYTIFYPETTTLTATFGGTTTSTGCVDFGGYHNELTLPTGMKIVYSAVPRCANFNGLNGIDMVTSATSHELLEAATDPYPFTAPAFSGTNGIGIGLELVIGGAELGDMCTANQGADYKPDGFEFTVQRGWSNTAAAAGHDPCVPAQAGPYFNGAPQMKDTVTLGGPGGSAIPGVKAAVGSDATFDVVLFSDAATDGDISVAVLDGNAALGRSDTHLTFTQDKTSGKNGDHIHVTVHVDSAETDLGVEPFFVETTYAGRTTFSGGVVGQQ